MSVMNQNHESLPAAAASTAAMHSAAAAAALRTLRSCAGNQLTVRR